MSPRLALVLALAGLSGCATVIEPPRDHDVSREAWIGPWDQIVRRHEQVKPDSYLALRASRELTLSSIRVAKDEPARLRAGACALIVIEGRGEARGADQTEELLPGRILLLPTGLGVTL